ncbi:MAG: iron-containing alcohol dehydrogenase [Erysipelotrichaceae bacterium]|nr:iron-containing alcohol dehydrogenase [Erysipelotrichaceae bacterium]
MANTFLTPKMIISGSDALSNAKNELKRLGRKAFIVTDATMVKLGNASLLENILKEIDVDYYIFSEVNFEPNDLIVIQGKDTYKDNNCDFLIALGGGSPIDTAKAISILLNNDAPLSSYMGKIINIDRPALVAIPTTAGTGSEATKFTIINDTATKVKMLLTGPCLIPDLAIIDPAFSKSAPKSVTSHTGIDALCHAVESYTSRKAQPLSDTFALSAIKRIFANLQKCYDDGSNIEARVQMSLAALEAGISFNNSSVTIVHGMSRPMGALFHVPHGLSNAMLLEECMNYVVDGAYDRFADISRYLSLTDDPDDVKAAHIFLKALSDLLRNLNVPTMSEYGIDKDEYFANLEKMANDAFVSGSPSNTIKEIGVQDMIELYKRIYR